MSDKAHTVILHDAAQGGYLKFTRPVRVVSALHLEEVIPCLEQVEALTQKGLYAAGFLSYEASPAFDPALEVREPEDDFPLLWFGIYKKPDPLDLEPPWREKAALAPEWTPIVSRESYDRALLQIKDHIAAGDTYQVNYTIRLRAGFPGPAWPLFLKLARAQKAQYAAYVNTGRYEICSASPELFFTLDKGKLLSKPMKGTAARGRTLDLDREMAEWLHQSTKNRAENVMIVDMIRNDMGRVAKTGTVQVPRLFEVERYPTVWQMTSTVTADTEKSLSQVMTALFPCASITGAPKCETMRIISSLETTPRRVYTGSMGFILPDGRAQFNVAIRTVVVDRDKQEAEYGVGGGILWDSDLGGEFEECRIKARVLTVDRPVFSLLETLLWTPGKGFFLLERHLKRLSGASEYFGFGLDLEKVKESLEQISTTFDIPQRVRLLAEENGKTHLEAFALDQSMPEPVRLAMATKPVDWNDPFLYFKTTRREVYEKARKEAGQCDDVLLFNEKGEITETTIANIVLEMEGTKYTPPIASGLLGGTYRAHLLDKGEIREKTLYKEDLARADRIFCINSVRKTRQAVLLDPA